MNRTGIMPAAVLVASVTIAARAQFMEGFDTYPPNTGIAGQGNWEIWHSGGNDSIVSPLQASSAPHSLRHMPLSDVVQRFSATSGVWEFSIMTYVPSSAPPGVGGSVIILNQYGSSAIDRWSMQIAMNETSLGGSQPLPYMVESQWDGGLLPLILDQWVQLRAEIDLDNDVFNTWYDGQHLTVNAKWSDNGFGAGPGVAEIAAIDLWSAGIDGMHLDDVILQPLASCYPDCDGSGTLDLFDFLCFVNEFNAGDPYADCDASGGLDLFDFLCFVNEFNAGCP